MTIDTTPLPTDYEYTLFDKLAAVSISFTHSSFIVTTLPFQHTLCGALTYRATFEGDPLDMTTLPILYDSDLNTFEIYSEDYSLIGLRDITVEAYLTDYSQITSPAPESTQLLIKDPCIDFLTITVLDQTAPASYLYTANTPELVFETVPFTTYPPECATNTIYSCAITVGSRVDLCSVTEANAFGGNTIGAFDQALGRFTFNSVNIVSFVPGPYTLEITGTSGSKSESFTVELLLVDPCDTVDL